uniref:Uncharacterized protein n=1 Tax=Leptobrachium leishanense TaxID=445787 RepID=A0A8C5PGR9_9ANUR
MYVVSSRSNARLTHRAQINTYPEVLWVHVQFVGMNVTQVTESGLNVIQVVGCLVNSPQNSLAMGLYFGVSDNGGFIGYVSKRTEVSLGPGVKFCNQFMSLPAQGIVAVVERSRLTFRCEN